MIPYRPKRVLVQDQSWNDGATREILEKLPGIEIQTIRDLDAVAVPAGQSAPGTYPKTL